MKCLIFTTTQGGGATIIPILQMKGPKHRDAKYLAQGHVGKRLAKPGFDPSMEASREAEKFPEVLRGCVTGPICL